MALVVLLAPWLFGAWEMWWFWPFAVAISAAVAFQAVRLILAACMGSGGKTLALPAAWRQLLLAYFPFLTYALLRALQAGVPMDAERSCLLHITPFLLGSIIVLGVSERQRRGLLALLLVNFCALAVYGIVNHYATGNARVLWVPGFPHYQENYRRATGSYFCPDHFAGLMELALALGLGLGLARGTALRWRVPALLLGPLALWGVVLSKSRGGGLVVLGMAVLALWWGLRQWPPRVRWAWRAAAALSIALLLGLMVARESAYVRRFRDYPWQQIEAADRYQMVAAALRAWRTAPLFGIGPGMHQNLWPHFAASPDGDRALGKRPTYLNNTFHSYEVHSDWIQLLEEYGVVGTVLFIVAVGSVAAALLRAWRHHAEAWAAGRGPEILSGPGQGVVLTALLAGAAMALHSWVDFNLQIPATVWLLAALVASGLAGVVGAPPSSSCP